jgi:hypothetical protein
MYKQSQGRSHPDGGLTENYRPILEKRKSESGVFSDVFFPKKWPTNEKPLMGHVGHSGDLYGHFGSDREEKAREAPTLHPRGGRTPIAR